MATATGSGPVGGFGRQQAVCEQKAWALRNEGRMGRYIEDILQPGERVLYSTTIHWIVYLPGFVGWIAAVAFLVLQRGATSDGLNLLWLALSGLSALVAAYWTFRAWFQRWTIETDVTSIRVVHKQGFITRDTFEMNLDKVESVDVTQGIAGRIFGFGDVTIRGVGDGEKKIAMISAPLAFRNTITTR